MRIERGDDPGPYSRYGDYKPHLRPLFRSRCAYCMTPDDCLGGMESMTVDHFLPRDRYEKYLTVWTNLYYACPVCNEHYKKNHPTEEEEKRGLGFIDPCKDDPDNHFWLVPEAWTGHFCKVRARTNRARFPTKVLKLNYRPFLRDLWRELHRRDEAARKLLKDVENWFGCGLTKPLDALRMSP